MCDASTTTSSSPPPPVPPILVADCGSSGTRIYQIGRDSITRQIFCRKIGSTIPKIVDAFQNLTDRQVFLQQLIHAAEQTHVDDVIIAATAGLRIAKANGTVTKQQEKSFLDALPDKYLLRELAGWREAELEFIVAMHLMNICCPPPPELIMSPNVGMISMGGRSMQFVTATTATNTTTNTTTTTKDDSSAAVQYYSIPFAAHSAQDHVRGAPFTAFSSLPPPVPRAQYLPKLDEVRNIVDEHCRNLSSSSNFHKMKGLIVGITGFATTSKGCGNAAGKVMRKSAFIQSLDKLIDTLSQLDQLSYDEEEAKQWNLQPESTFGALTKTVVCRQIVDNMVDDDAYLLCSEQWMLPGAIQPMGTEWTLGIFLERENARKPGGLRRTISGGYWEKQEEDCTDDGAREGGGSREGDTREDDTWNDTCIQALVDERVACRRSKNYERSDEIRVLLNKHNIVIKDIPWKSGGGSTWGKIEPPSQSTQRQGEGEGGGTTSSSSSENSSSKSSSSSSSDSTHEPTSILNAIAQRPFHNNNVVRLLHHDLLLPSKLRQIQGRTSADIAFRLALSGHGSTEIYNLLLQNATEEIQRCRQKLSFRPYDMIVMCEKFAVAGCCRRHHRLVVEGNGIDSCAAFYGAVVEIGREKLRKTVQQLAMSGSMALELALSDIEHPSYGLLSSRPLLSLWRYSARQRKYGKQVSKQKTSTMTTVVDTETEVEAEVEAEAEAEAGEAVVMTVEDIESMFEDPDLPMVVDLGCGWGTTLLGLSRQQQQEEEEEEEEEEQVKRIKDKRRKKRRNYLGVDMSDKCVGYGNNVARRWGVKGCCSFVVASVDDVLVLLEKSQRICVDLFLIQFPTPYRVSEFAKTMEGSSLAMEQEEMEGVAGSESRSGSSGSGSSGSGSSGSGSSGNGSSGSGSSGNGSSGNGSSGEERDRKRRKVVGGATAASKKGEKCCSGNQQLPFMEDFMITPAVLIQMERILLLSRSSTLLKDKEEEGNMKVMRGVYLQSNAEDVAVTMSCLLRKHCSRLIPVQQMEFAEAMETVETVETVEFADASVMKKKEEEEEGKTRQDRYLNMLSSSSILMSQKQTSSSEQEQSSFWLRAMGPEWWTSSPFSMYGRTETEAMCSAENKNVYRMWCEL